MVQQQKQLIRISFPEVLILRPKPKRKPVRRKK